MGQCLVVGSKPYGSISINSNGTYNITNYRNATVSIGDLVYILASGCSSTITNIYNDGTYFINATVQKSCTLYIDVWAKGTFGTEYISYSVKYSRNGGSTAIDSNSNLTSAIHHTYTIQALAGDRYSGSFYREKGETATYCIVTARALD